MPLIDLSHEIFDGLITYKGLPAPQMCDFWSREQSKDFYENGESFQIGQITMVANTGTYLDTPFHRYENGKDLAAIELQNLVDLPAQIIDCSKINGLAIAADFLEKQNISQKAILFKTNWSQNWNTEKYFENHPFLTEEAAQYLVDKKVLLVGIDSHNIDDTCGKARPVHTILLAQNILIVEHLCNLSAVTQPNNFRFTAAPPKIKGMGTFPVRAYASY